MINSHKVTKHACTSSWLPLAHSIHHTYHQVTVMNKHYNMTVWILARNDINFSMAAGLIRLAYARRQVIWCVTKASACHYTLHANHWHCLWKISPIIAVKSFVTTSIQVLRFVVNMFYCGRIAFTVFKHADIKGVRQRLTSTASLNDGYCEATIPFVKGHHVT